MADIEFYYDFGSKSYFVYSFCQLWQKAQVGYNIPPDFAGRAF